jgi:hypothetical protein
MSIIKAAQKKVRGLQSKAVLGKKWETLSVGKKKLIN